MVGDWPLQEANVGPFQIKTRRGWQSLADFVRRHTRIIGLWAVLSSVLIGASSGFQEVEAASPSTRVVSPYESGAIKRPFCGSCGRCSGRKSAGSTTAASACRM